MPDHNDQTVAASTGSTEDVTKGSIEAVGQPEPGYDPKNKQSSSAALNVVDGLIFVLGVGILTPFQQFLTDIGVHLSPRWFNLVGLLMCETAVAHAVFRWLKRFRWSAWVGLGVLAAAQAGILFAVPPKPEPESPEPAPRPARPDDLIEGTTFTHSVMTNVLPFGYVVFYWRDNEVRSWLPYPDSRLDWEVDWNMVKIAPNFAERTVVFEFPDIAFSYIRDGQRVRVGGGNSVRTKPITMNVGDLRGIGAFTFGKNEPMLCVATLSDNQRTPVFVVGFRIDDSGARQQAAQ